MSCLSCVDSSMILKWHCEGAEPDVIRDGLSIDEALVNLVKRCLWYLISKAPSSYDTSVRFEGLSVAESKSKTLVPTLGRLNSIIISLLNITQILPCLFLFPIDVPQNLSVCQDDHYRCHTYRYQNFVACVVIRFVIVPVNFLLLKSARYPKSMSNVDSRAAATLPISWMVPNKAMAIPRFLGSKLLQLIHETMMGWELGVPIISVRIANLTHA